MVLKTDFYDVAPKSYGGYGVGDYEERLKNEQNFHNNDDWRKNREHLGKYRSIFSDKKGTTAYRNEIIEKYSNPNNTILLDYGCGDGVYLLACFSKIKSGIGIDISQKEIEIAENKLLSNNIGNIKFFVMDAMNTEFADKTFDIIHGNAILHHLFLEKSIIEIKRILKDNGVCVFIEPLSTNPIIELYRKLTPKLRTPDEQPFRKKELKIIKKHFQNTEIKYFAFFTLLGVLFRKRKNFNKILDILYKFDEIVLSNKSPFKYLAWVCVLEIRK
ncbi:MAG: class I SAM-dependent methyltransferase [Treponema sp.]|nr:class I SAM-dependent methyltransferase [Treponema sp.]